MTARCTDDSILIGLDGEHLKAIARSSRNAERIAKKVDEHDTLREDWIGEGRLHIK